MLFAITSLALGIGVTTAIYSAVRTLLWVPLGVPHQGELVQVVNGQLSYGSMSWPDFDALGRFPVHHPGLARSADRDAAPRAADSILAALAACYFPAARAARVDPNVALRDL